MIATDEQIQALEKALGALDFKQEGAHTVFNELNLQTERIMVKDANWREFRFFKLGMLYAAAKYNYETTPPITVHKEPTMEGKTQ